MQITCLLRTATTPNFAATILSMAIALAVNSAAVDRYITTYGKRSIVTSGTFFSRVHVNILGGRLVPAMRLSHG